MDLLGGMDFSVSAILAGIIFGIIGLLIYKEGRKRTHFELYAIGVVLMVYPYFITHEIGVWVVGIVLTVFAFKLMRDS